MQKIIRVKGFISVAAALFIATAFSSCVGGQLGQDNSNEYRNGMVVSANEKASRVGLDILKRGGNAVDAAVAVQFALAVVYPNAGNIGGGGFMVYRDASGEMNSLDFRETAPATASRDMYLDSVGKPIVDKSLEGHLASGIPGSVAGMVAAHAKYGKLKWADLIEPAIALAKNGFKLSEQQVDELNRLKARFVKNNPQGTALAKETEWLEDDVLIQPELATTLEKIRDYGRAGFYEGPVADSLLAEMRRGGGIISAEDLKNYKAVWRKPIVGNYKGYRIVTMPPPSSGGIALIQLLKSVEPYPLKRWGLNSDSTVQLMVEAERRVYADRAEYLGDPDFYKVPQAQLLNDAYIKSRMANFNWAHATPSSEIKAGVLRPAEHEETTHFSIVDRDGNAVSVTTTLNGSYGSAVVVKGGGFLLNNEMDDFSVKPGSPNMYGLVGGEANAIAPGKRMLSSMTPTIVEKDGKLFMIVGTPGGSTIITSVFQTIVNVIEFNKTMQSAVNAKKFHHQWLPDTLYVEKGALDSVTTLKLINKGYPILERGPIGRVDAILKTKWGYYQGGADKRGDDKAMAW
ncbi:gamma-glutamyltranspeptidase / glutathione hydrolase [Pedobacter sp. ok626]|uniref:gamma-glutamyltransferase n=1 Tax=Pedobacter sp. ok626 TaxID=1761882 RepID=UPI00088A7CD8|nr:gamma-glutamyltransferase [Pedobacter sp. ok626]SDK71923.1 gamma-glutamyltranspeptidase / glutathione hydrolase [Pedobacter sp. ok626]